MTPEQREARKRSRALERRMSQDNFAEEEKIKLLLLGAGESGKSTIFKQMRIMYGDEMKEKELKTFISIVRANCLSSMLAAVLLVAVLLAAVLLVAVLLVAVPLGGISQVHLLLPMNL